MSVIWACQGKLVTCIWNVYHCLSFRRRSGDEEKLLTSEWMETETNGISQKYMRPVILDLPRPFCSSKRFSVYFGNMLRSANIPTTAYVTSESNGLRLDQRSSRIAFFRISSNLLNFLANLIFKNPNLRKMLLLNILEKFFLEKWRVPKIRSSSYFTSHVSPAKQ